MSAEDEDIVRYAQESAVRMQRCVAERAPLYGVDPDGRREVVARLLALGLALELAALQYGIEEKRK